MALIDLLELPEFCFSPPPTTASWVQFDIGLLRIADDARASAHRLFDLINQWWEPRAREGEVMGWFFMRKPPDVRLRLLTIPTARRALSELENTLQRAVAEGAIAGCDPGHYEAEVARFGGPAAITAVHAMFMLDGMLWYRLEQLARRALRLIDPHEFKRILAHAA